MSSNKKSVFLQGLRDGIPIGLGYLAVSFSLGIAAGNVGVKAMEGFFASLFTYASAGEYAVFRLIGEASSLVLVALMTMVASGRYVLMSCALSQRFSPETGMLSRLLVGLCITDEIFGITIAREGYIEPVYSYGAWCMASPLWALGTALGIIAGNLMPVRLVSALSVALYGMFLAIIIPPAKKDRLILALVALSFLLSAAFAYLPLLCSLSEGNRTLLLTVAISAGAALLFPRKEEQHA